MDERVKMIALMAAAIYGARLPHHDGSYDLMRDSIDDAREILRKVESQSASIALEHR